MPQYYQRHCKSNSVSYNRMYYYVISFVLSTPMARLNSITYVRAYIIISYIYYVCIIAPALISHPFTNMHQKTILVIIYFQNRWSHDSIVEPTYVLIGSPGHYQLKIICLKLSFFQVIYCMIFV